MQLWTLTSYWTINDDGNDAHDELGIYTSPEAAQAILAKPPHYEFERTYELTEWTVDAGKTTGTYYWRMVGRYGTWDKVYYTGRIINGAALVDRY
jgi:hypothetical protein